VGLAAAWQAVDALVPRDELRAALSTVVELAPTPSPAGAAAEWRAELSRRIATVSGFLKLLQRRVVDFGADAEAEAVLAAMRAVPVPAGRQAQAHGKRHRPWSGHRALEGPGARPPAPRRWGGRQERLRVLCAHPVPPALKRHGIYAPGSTRWTDRGTRVAALARRATWASVKGPCGCASGSRGPHRPAGLTAPS